MDEEVFESRGHDARRAPPAEDGGGLAQNSSAHARRSPVKSARYSVADPYPEFYAILGDDGLSVSQKELAARLYAALRAISNWLVDLEAWIWIESFAQEPLAIDGPHAQSSATAMPHPAESWESLPLSVVDQYERQLDSIFEDLDKLSLDELKEMVLDIHQGNSRPSSSYSTFTESKLAFLDDFSFFVTSVMLQILPQHARLKQRLHTWSIRISVFHLIPSFLEQISLLRVEMDRLWPELTRDVSPDDSSLDVEQNRLELLKETAQAHISNAGRVLDDMLDLLEGQSDVLPVKWIDGFESLENDFSSWTLASEQKMFRLRSANAPPLGIFSPMPMNGNVPESSLPTSSPSGPSANALEEPVITGLAYASSLVLPVSENHHIITTPDINAPAHEDPPTAEADHFSPVVRAEESIQLQNASHETSEVREVNSTHTPQKENCSAPNASPGHQNDLSQEHDEHQITQPAADEEAEGIPIAVCGNDPHDSSSTASRVEPPKTPPPVSKDEHQNPPGTVFDSLASHSPELNPLPPSSSSGLGDSLSAPSRSNDDTVVIQHKTVCPDVRTPPMYAADDDSLLLPELPRLSIVSDLDEDNVSELDDSPTQTRPFAKASRPPLNSLMKKRREKFPILQITDMGGESDNSNGDHRSADSRLTPVSPSMPLEEQISNILDAIPTPIKFRSGPNANDPQIKSSRFRSTSSQLRRAAANLTHNAPILTLAPADEQRPRRNGNDPDIRLYHLIQTGRDKPIKLFIRRVGENGDRVMVRVGGGWADLAEYLRIYAEHHGRRAVSDGRVEIQPLAGAAPGSSTPKASSSRRSSMLSQSRPGSTTPMAEPGSRPASAMSSPQNYLDTPQSASASAASRRLASWDEAGLAGPFAKRAGVSDEKKEWIDGIVEQAKRSMGNIDVGELGKSGSTRRVFLKGKSPAPDS